MITFRAEFYVCSLLTAKGSPFFIGIDGKNFGSFDKCELPYNLNGTIISFATDGLSVPFIVNGNELYFWASGTALGGGHVILRCHICCDGHMETKFLWHPQMAVGTPVLNDVINVVENMQVVHPEVENWGPALEHGMTGVVNKFIKNLSYSNVMKSATWKFGTVPKLFRVLVPENYPIPDKSWEMDYFSSDNILNELRQKGIQSYSLTMQNGIRQWVDRQGRIMDMEQFLSDLYRNTTFFF